MEIFVEFLDKLLAIFVTDFTLCSKKDHLLGYLRMVFTRCKEKKICLEPFKCVLFVTRGKLLGHVVSKEGIAMSPNKGKVM